MTIMNRRDLGGFAVAHDEGHGGVGHFKRRDADAGRPASGNAFVVAN
jgi:hypothetical protein